MPVDAPRARRLDLAGMNANVQKYLERRRKLQTTELAGKRLLCTRCLQPEFGCYCAYVRPFHPSIKFVVLIHPLEARRRIATGRMSHLCLSDSLLVRGEDFSESKIVNVLVEDSSRHCVVLYPGLGSTDLSAINEVQRRDLFPEAKELVIFVIDGTWRTARKMVRSRCLAHLPRVCFAPRTPSRFRVRKQPAPECWSTIEAIHQTIELVGPARGFSGVEQREHDNMLFVFDRMVERQLAFVKDARVSRHSKRLRSNELSLL